jgi:hypothetical protein
MRDAMLVSPIHALYGTAATKPGQMTASDRFADDKEGRSSFLKKRTKKLLFVGRRAGRTGAAPMSKSFLLLFFKKEVLKETPWTA